MIIDTVSIHLNDLSLIVAHDNFFLIFIVVAKAVSERVGCPSIDHVLS